MIAVENLDFRYGQSDFRLRVPKLVIEQGAKVAHTDVARIAKAIHSLPVPPEPSS